MTKNNFNKIAWCYDFLARLVFGKNLLWAQCYFVDRISAKSSVLIMGGGTGQLVSAMVMHDPTQKITFVEASEEMIRRARQSVPSPTINWICGTEEDIPDESYDVIITPFFLDLFSDTRLAKVVSILNSKLSNSGSWIATDFVAEAWWHSIFLKVMYGFFKVACNLETTHLPEWQSQIAKAGYQKVHEKYFYRSFIKSIVYQRNSKSI